jgi:hydrogenase/urease accessory protein HupE
MVIANVPRYLAVIAASLLILGALLVFRWDETDSS